jgi:glycosyltransferase involved in cell wall biosynthesis
VDPGVFIIVRAFNEGPRLGPTLDALLPRYPSVVVVDDGSSDDTSRVALQRPVWLLRHPINSGGGAALKTGLDFALQQGAQILVCFDADGQHDQEEIPAVIEPIRSGRADVVLGSRFLGRSENMPLSRWLVLKGGIIFTRVFSRIPVTDTHNGFRALSAEAARRIKLTQPRMSYASELIDQIRVQGLRFCEVPVTIRYTQETLAKGQSSWNAVRIIGELIHGRLTR